MSWLLSKINPWAQPAADVDHDMRAIQHMEDTEAVKQKLTLQYMQHLQRAEELADEAKQLSREKKIGMAKAKLKQSHRFRGMAQQALGQLNNLENVQLNVESAATNVEVMGVMRDGTQHMSAMMQQLHVEDVDDVTDSLQENAAEVADMSNALSRPIFDSHLDIDVDDDIDAQLRQWQDETDIVQAQRVTTELPDAPVKSVSNNNNNNGGNGGGKVVQDKTQDANTHLISTK